MMTPEQLDAKIQTERIQQLEEKMIELMSEIQELQLFQKEAQRIIVKIATSQQQVVERISHWPYVKISENDK